MATINDDKLQAVRTLLGVTTGDIQARWREHLVALTSGSGTLNDLEMLWLGSLGYTGALNDRWRAYLTGLSYTGAVNDQIETFWVAGGMTFIEEGSPSDVTVNSIDEGDQTGAGTISLNLEEGSI